MIYIFVYREDLIKRKLFQFFFSLLKTSSLLSFLRPSQFVSLTVYLFVSLSLSRPFSLYRISVFLSHSLSACISLSLSMPLSLSPFVSVSQISIFSLWKVWYICISSIEWQLFNLACLCLFFSLWLPEFLWLSIYAFISLSVCLANINIFLGSL